MECALENITVYYEVFGEGRLLIILLNEWLDRVEESTAVV